MISKDKLTVVMYHYVRDLKNSRYPSIKGLQSELFKEQVRYLKKNYNIISVEQVIASIKDGSFESLPHNSVLLTFDDGYSDHFNTVFPILKNEGVPGAFYAPVKAVTEHTVLDVNKIHFILASTPEGKLAHLLNEIKLLLNEYKEEYLLQSFDYYFDNLAIANRFDPKEVIFVKRLLQVELPEHLRNVMSNILFDKIVGIEESAFSRELYMSLDQIKCMSSNGMHIGSHGYDHYWLGSLSKEKQQFEIQKSIEFISQIGGDVNNWSICYPYGNYNEDTISLLKENGCRLGLTTEVDLVSLDKLDGASIFELPRLDTNDLPKDAHANPIKNKWY